MTEAEMIVSHLLEDDEKKLPPWLAKKLGREEKEGDGESEDGESESSGSSDTPRKSGGGGSSFASSEGTVKKTW